MRELLLGKVLKAALIAGLIAGIAVSVFHLVATEPVIEQAIMLEEQHAGAAAQHEEPVVSRDGQRVGLILGFVLYGLTWSTLLGVGYYAAQRWLPAAGVAQRGWLLAGLSYWAVGLFPFLKYPANPPGVGDPETITYRQSLYLLTLALSVAGVALALALSRRQDGNGRGVPADWRRGAGIVAAVALAVYFLLPGNPDPVEMPADLVMSFRALSLVGITLFWAVLGGVFGVLLRRNERNGQALPSR